MYYSYGIHKKQWNTIKEEVVRDNIKSTDISTIYELDSRQVWFLYDKLLQGKYDHLYIRDNIDKDSIKLGDYVHSNDYGRGEIATITDEFIIVRFIDKELGVMYHKDGRPTTDTVKITKL